MIVVQSHIPREKSAIELNESNELEQSFGPKPQMLSEIKTKSGTTCEYEVPLTLTTLKAVPASATSVEIQNPKESVSTNLSNTKWTPSLKTVTGKKASDLFNSIAEAFFQIHEHDLAVAAESSKGEQTASNTPSGSGTPELRKWMKQVVSTELRTCMRELARKAMNEEETNQKRDTQYALEPSESILPQQ